MKSSTLFKRLLRTYVVQHRVRIAWAVVCMVLVAAATAANAWMMQPVLDHVFIQQNRSMLLLVPLAVVGIAIVSALANYGQIILMRYVGQRIVADVQMQLFAHLMRSDLSLFHEQASGRLISRFTNDIQMMRAAVSNLLTSFAKDLLTTIFLVGVMIYQSAELAAIALLVFPLAFYPIIMLGKRMRKLSEHTQHQLGEFTAQLDEVFQGARTVKAYAREAFEVSRAKTTIHGLFKTYLRVSRVQAAASPMMEVFSGIAVAAVIWYGGMQVLEGTTTPGAFFSFIAAFLMAYKPVKSMASANTSLQEGIAAAARLFAVLDAPPKVQEMAGAPKLAVARGQIVFDKVSFCYNDDGRGVGGLSLEIPAGKTVALVGGSGGGKTTVMNLLLRFYDVDSGTIAIDGQNIKTVSLTSLREAMALVPQETILFDDTIAANIGYGKLGASEEEIIAASVAADADSFIRALPEGYQTMIGPHGVRLSGGQRQRLSIARAMLKNAPILLLDEATSALDNESERAVQHALATLMKGRTTLVIAHRLSTIIHADLIYVIEQGRIEESGTHDSLLAARGKYYQLYATHAL